MQLTIDDINIPEVSNKSKLQLGDVIMNNLMPYAAKYMELGEREDGNGGYTEYHLSDWDNITNYELSYAFAHCVKPAHPNDYDAIRMLIRKRIAVIKNEHTAK